MRQRRSTLEQQGLLQSQQDDTGLQDRYYGGHQRRSIPYLWRKLIRAPLTFPKVVLFFAMAILVLIWFRQPTLQHQQGRFPNVPPIRRRSKDTYDVFHCPEVPPSEGYPREYPILEVLRNWNTHSTDPPEVIYQGICVFDFAKSVSSSDDHIRRQIQNYRAAEVPFVVRNDPAVLKSVELWSDPNYLSSKLQGRHYQATLSNTTRMTYYSMDSENNIIPDDFVPWTKNAPMSFSDWYDKATTTTNPKRKRNAKTVKAKYAYLRLDACLPDRSCDCNYRCNPDHINDADFIYEDLPFFYPSSSGSDQHPSPSSSSSSSPPLYDIDIEKARGIQCRFGTPGLTAEAHFDNERNYIAMIGGARRYLLAHPRSCSNLHLYPQKHPLERHTRVDWSLPFDDDDDDDKNSSTPLLLKKDFPNFDKATLNEVILNEGDVLYLPTYWFHHIVSLTTVNYQCNTRSGYSVEYDQTIYDCGFFYDFPTS